MERLNLNVKDGMRAAAAASRTPDAGRLAGNQVAQAPELDAPGGELEEAQFGILRRLPERTQVVAQWGRRRFVQLPEAGLLFDPVLPLGAAVCVDLLMIRVPVRKRDIGVAREVLH